MNLNHIRTEIFGLPMDIIGLCGYFIVPLKNFCDFYDTNNIKVWEHQRSLDNDRAMELSNSLSDEYKRSGDIKLRGAILLCKKHDLLFNDDVYYIIDGQHRFFAMKRIVSLVPGLKIRVDIILVDSNDQIKREFHNINKSVPVPFHYLQPSDIINTCYSELQTKFKKSFRSGTCRRPHINIDKFKDIILREEIIKIFNIKNGGELTKLFMLLHYLYDFYQRQEENTGYRQLFKMCGAKINQDKDVVLNNIPKCKSGKYLYIGLCKEDHMIVWINFMKQDDTKEWLISNMKIL